MIDNEVFYFPLFMASSIAAVAMYMAVLTFKRLDSIFKLINHLKIRVIFFIKTKMKPNFATQ